MLHLLVLCFTMPTINPRVTVTISPQVAAVLKELSDAGGNSQSAIVGELLETALPVLERVALALRAAASIQSTARDEIAAGLGRAQDKMEAQLPLLLGELDAQIRPILDAAERVGRRGVGKGGGRVLATPERARDASTKRDSGVTTPVPLTGGLGRSHRRSKGGSDGGL